PAPPLPPLPLHDALPISPRGGTGRPRRSPAQVVQRGTPRARRFSLWHPPTGRSLSPLRKPPPPDGRDLGCERPLTEIIGPVRLARGGTMTYQGMLERARKLERQGKHGEAAAAYAEAAGEMEGRGDWTAAVAARARCARALAAAGDTGGAHRLLDDLDRAAAAMPAEVRAGLDAQ